jgi:hypothetical protein
LFHREGGRRRRRRKERRKEAKLFGFKKINPDSTSSVITFLIQHPEGFLV